MNLQEQYRLNPVQPYTPNGLRDYPFTIPSEHLIGIEVEVENVAPSARLNQVWRTVSDGSLRNSGVEYVTHPIKACHAPAALQHLLTEALNGDCHFSPRTSVHVHLNVQDLTTTQLLDLVLVYSVYERLFYKFVGRGRRSNIFCVPITETNLLLGLVGRGTWNNWSKYTGLNLVPVRGTRGEGAGAYGTIEFRHMHGTASIDKLCIWIDLITTLKEYVLKTSTKEIRTTIDRMNDDFDFGEHLKAIFGDKATFLRYEKFDEVKHTHMQAKSAMLNTKVAQRLRATYSSSASFYKFKG